MKPLATPDLREISSTETPSQPLSRNNRKAVAKRLRCLRSASSRVGRPPGPRLNSPCSSGASDMRRLLLAANLTKCYCNDTVRLQKVKSRGPTLDSTRYYRSPRRGRHWLVV